MHEHRRCALILSKVNFIIILVFTHDYIYPLTKYNIFLLFKSCIKPFYEMMNHDSMLT